MKPTEERRGPLAGVRVIELAGIGPAPFSAMMLADLGADVLRVERPGYLSPANQVPPERDLLNRSRRSVGIDLKTPGGRDLLLELVSRADVLLEGFRPGVTERLGVGPDDCFLTNRRLVYGRMTGWGQDGPLAHTAGHDINYISLGGALGAIGTVDRPVPPLNLVGDFGGGAMFLAMGVIAALFEAQRSGEGQVVDAAIVDGTAVLSTIFFGIASETPSRPRGENLLDGGCHYYQPYRCADGRWLSVGAIEPKFYAQFLRIIGVEDDAEFVAGHQDQALWAGLCERTTAIIAARPLDAWMELFDGTDACVAPVVELANMSDHPHNRERGVIIEVDGLAQPAPAPRFSRTPLPTPTRPPRPAEHTFTALQDWGIADDVVERYAELGAITQGVRAEARP